MKLDVLKRLLRAAAAVIVTTALCFGIVNPALAKEESSDVAMPKVTVDNKIIAPEGVTVPSLTYKYVFDFVDKDGDQAYEGAPEITIEDVKRKQDDRSEIENKIDFGDIMTTVEDEEESVFVNAPAGVYTYTVSRITTNPPKSEDGYTYTPSTETYTMKIYIINAPRGLTSPYGGDTYIDSITITPAGEEGNEKAKVDSLEFIDQLTRTGGNGDNGTITLRKLVKEGKENAYADKEKNFTFTFRIDAIAENVNRDAITIESDNEEDGAWSSNEAVLKAGDTYTIKLRDGESVDIKGLPYGTVYTITEEMADNGLYTATSTGKDNTTGKVFEKNSVTNAVLSDTLGNDLTVTNTRETVTPTGIFIDNLPFILLIVIGAAGIGAYLFSRRRRYQR